MIDIENEVYAAVSKAVRVKYPKVYMTGLPFKAPPSFPCISFSEVDNQVYRATRTSGNIENHVQVVYRANVYSNSTTKRKSECKDIISIIDETMMNLGFTRTMCSPVDNEEDSTVYRMIAQYRAVVSKDKVIYRR